MADAPLRILVLGAHPDDADFKAGGCAAKWCALGHTVKLVSLTDGRSGHQTQYGPTLAQRRRTEAQASGAVIGATYDILDNPDGELLPTLEARRQVIRLIRGFRPDLVFTHRLNDYHPDHRYTASLVQDAAYLLTVPAICPDTPHLPRDPVIMYLSDFFKKPYPLRADLVVDIEDELDTLVRMLHCHESQFYEWLPYNGGYVEQVPAGAEARRAWHAERLRERIRPLADLYRDQVVRTYGPERGPQVRYIEAFEVSEYGSRLDEDARARLFPFLPASSSPAPVRTRRHWADIPDDK